MKSKKSSENEKQEDMFILEWLLQEPIENNFKKIYNPKPFNQIAKKNVNIDDKQLNKEIAKKMNNPHYFIDGTLKVGFIFFLENHHINHAKSKIIMKPNFPILEKNFNILKKT